MLPVRVTSALETDGFASVEGIEAADLLSFANGLGQPQADTNDPAIVRDLHPVAASRAAPNTLSGRHGTGTFPFHTETAYWRHPARYVLLYCVNPGAGGRPTVVKDVLAPLSVRDLKALSSELWVVGKRRRPFLTCLVEAVGSRVRLRFDADCMRPVDQGAVGRALMAEALDDATPVAVEWHSGDLLILDNFRVVHGRGSSLVPDEDRHLQRVLVAAQS